MFSSVLLASSVFGAEGHGYMTVPHMRSVGPSGDWQNPAPYQYEPQSSGASAGGTPIGICGRENSGAINRNPAVGDTVTDLGASGSQFTVGAHISAHHLGHMIVRICPEITSSSTVAGLADCIRLSGSNGDTWPLTAGVGPKEWTVTLPSKAELEALGSADGVFTMQWRWNTANSCTPATTLSGNCDDTICCSEVFTNCADVVFSDIAHTISSAPAAPLPSPTPATPTPASGGGETPDTTGSESGCVATAGWANSPNDQAWCRNPANNPQTSETCYCGGSASPEPESEPEPAVDHVVTALAAPNAVLAGLSALCEANKAYVCSTTSTNDLLGALCECSAPITSGTSLVGTAATKFGGKIRQRMERVQIAAQGSLSLDED